jgi:carbonic anhydrase
MDDACEKLATTFSRRRFVQLGVAGAAVVAGVTVGDSGPGLARADDATPSAEEHESAHWTYEGEEGPEHWGELDPDYASCSGGTQQSPIDVSKTNGADIANIEFSYQPVSPLHLINNGHTLQVNIPEGSSITLDGVTYPLKQFHFHAPSEHTVDGRAEAMELHLVHMTDDGTTAVVGVLLAEGEGNPALTAVFEAMPAMAGSEQEVTGSVDLAALLPEQRTTYRYMGSLTTPPCSEGVDWLLMTEASSVAPAQVEAFRTVFGADARPVQPLNGRTVTEDTSA